MSIVTSSMCPGFTKMSFDSGLSIFFKKDLPIAANVPGMGMVQSEQYVGDLVKGRVVSDKFLDALIENSLS